MIKLKDIKKQYALTYCLFPRLLLLGFYSSYLVRMSRLLRVSRRRYSSPACIMRISRPRANKLFECSIGSEWAVSLRVNKLNGAFILATPWYMLNDLNDNHYRMRLSTFSRWKYKKLQYRYMQSLNTLHIWNGIWLCQNLWFKLL